jgi:hypothetical protein
MLNQPHNWRRAAGPCVLIAVLSLFVWLEISSLQTPGAQTNQQSAQSAQPDIDLRTPEERVADYTLWLERFTGLLVVVAIFQVILLFRTDKTAREGLAIADKQIQIAAAQTDIAIEQKQIARNQYVATHRPKVIVRLIMMRHPRVGERMRITYRVINGGSTVAYIDKLDASVVLVYPGATEALTWPVGTDKLSGVSIDPGAMRLLDTADALPPYEQHWGVRERATDYRLNIFGTIGYHDETGRKMETGFDRLYDFSLLRFIADKESEREYAD